MDKIKKRVSPAPYGALFHSVLLFYRNLSLKSIILWLFVMTIRFLILCLLLRKKYLVLDSAWFSFIFMREKSSMIFSDCFVAFFVIFGLMVIRMPGLLARAYLNLKIFWIKIILMLINGLIAMINYIKNILLMKIKKIEIIINKNYYYIIFSFLIYKY